RVDDRSFLVTVLLGMAVVQLLYICIVATLHESHPVPVRSVFFGMIVVSVAVPLRLMPGRFRALDGVLMALAAVAGFLLTSLPPGQVDDPSLWFVVLGEIGRASCRDRERATRACYNVLR